MKKPMKETNNIKEKKTIISMKTSYDRIWKKNYDAKKTIISYRWKQATIEFEKKLW